MVSDYEILRLVLSDRKLMAHDVELYPEGDTTPQYVFTNDRVYRLQSNSMVLLVTASRPQYVFTNNSVYRLQSNSMVLLATASRAGNVARRFWLCLIMLVVAAPVFISVWMIVQKKRKQKPKC